MAEDLYDEELDQEGNMAAADKEKDDGGYETFLAPKSAFAGKDVEVGAVHRVRIERILDSELELRCIKGKGNDESESDDNSAEESDEMYE